MCTAGADVDGCVGMDRWGYGVSSRGYRGHDGVWEEWEGGPWTSGDVIGVWVQLGGDSTPAPPPTTPMDPALSALLSQQQAAIFLLGSSLRFYRNGTALGAAFSPLLRATAYYPALSLYYGAEVEVNFGPDFKGEVPQEVHGGWWPRRGGRGGEEAEAGAGEERPPTCGRGMGGRRAGPQPTARAAGEGEGEGEGGGGEGEGEEGQGERNEGETRQGKGQGGQEGSGRTAPTSSQLNRCPRPPCSGGHPCGGGVE